jgi:hypothetical protein
MTSRKKPWRGTATQLLKELTINDRTEQNVAVANKWPKDHRQFGTALSEAIPSLRKVGVIVTQWREGHNRTRLIELRLAAEKSEQGGQADDADKQTRPIERKWA